MAMGLNFFFGPIASALCERIGCRLTALAGAILAVSGLLLSSFITSKDVPKMYATYGVMWGVGSSLCYVPSMVILGQYFNKRMALANGLGTSGSCFGTLIMAPVIQILLSTLGKFLLVFLHITVPLKKTSKLRIFKIVKSFPTYPM